MKESRLDEAGKIMEERKHSVWRDRPERAMRSRLEPIKKVARSLRAHEDLILNWFAAKKEYSSGIVEGFNNTVKLTIRKAYGFRELEAAQIALYHALARLPEPKHDHRFC